MSDRNNSLAMQRIVKLLDDRSFMEIGETITARNTDFNLKAVETPSDGVITGHGLVNGILVFVYSQDASVLNGTIGEMHAKKIANIYAMALKIGAPVVGFIDCGGVRLQESLDGLQGLGELFLKQAQASGVIPQITAVVGNCGGGLTNIPALSDFAFIEESKGKLFVNSPNTFLHNKVEVLDTTNAHYQSKENGFVDGVGTEEEIIVSIRNLICLLPENQGMKAIYDECNDDMNRLCLDMNTHQKDARYLLKEISDEHIFFETKKDFAPCLVTGFIRLGGTTVGAVANTSELRDENGSIVQEFDKSLSAKACQKAADFVSFCDAFNIPIVTLTDVKGFKANVSQESSLAKAMARLIYAFSNATVPKVNLMIGTASGSAYLMMNAKAIGADLVYAWPESNIEIMDSMIAAKIMYENESSKVIIEKAKEFQEQQSGIVTAAKRGYVDKIIKEQDSRKYLIAAFELLYTKKEVKIVKKHGTK